MTDHPVITTDHHVITTDHAVITTDHALNRIFSFFLRLKTVARVTAHRGHLTPQGSLNHQWQGIGRVRTTLTINTQNHAKLYTYMALFLSLFRAHSGLPKMALAFFPRPPSLGRVRRTSSSTTLLYFL